MIIYILTKFGADWLIFVDARVLINCGRTVRRRTDGHRRTKSDHNSLLSTPCSGELISIRLQIFCSVRKFRRIYQYIYLLLSLNLIMLLLLLLS